MTYRKRRRGGRLLDGVHWRTECRWWPTENYQEYESQPWGDLCNACAALDRRDALASRRPVSQ